MSGERDDGGSKSVGVLEGWFFLWTLLGALVLWGLVLLSPPVSFLEIVPAGESPEPSPIGVPAEAILILGLPVFAVYTVLFHLVASVGLVADARQVAASTDEWAPRPGLLGLGGLVVPELVVPYYLWKRHRTVGSTPVSAWWRTLVVVLLVAGVGSLVAGVVGPPVALLAQLVVVPALAVSVYQDAKTVRRTKRWSPGPMGYFLAVFLSGITMVGPYLVGGYYRYRHRRIG